MGGGGTRKAWRNFFPQPVRSISDVGKIRRCSETYFYKKKKLHWSVKARQKMNSASSMKRSYSVSDSDDCSDDDGRNCAVTSGSQSYRSPNRKRRRGVIEKRRRDRINCSLDELKRLVPQAFEKSGSAKLEKAEILQMTVDHLKLLHANKAYDMNGGIKLGSMDTHKIATDYHGLGSCPNSLMMISLFRYWASVSCR